MSEGIDIVKMSGAGNDFVVLGTEQRARLGRGFPEWVRRVCRRGLSVGADGVLVVERAGAGRVRVEFSNPDGSPAFCGNGSRCAARFAHARGLAGSAMVLETAAGELEAEVGGESVRLALPAPVDHGALALDPEGHGPVGRFVLAGVPHFVLLETPAGVDPLALWGPRVRRDPRFGPEGTNFDLVERGASGELGLRTWERGVEGETLSCGSGAVAAAFAARLAGGPSSFVVRPASGIPLTVELPGPPERPLRAVLAGDARFVFSGRLDEEATLGFDAAAGGSGAG